VSAPSAAAGSGARIERLDVRACRIPTDAPEADGTLAWDATTIVLVEARAGDRTGIGYSYADVAAADVIAGPLQEAVLELDAFATPAAALAMERCVRNLGRTGIASLAISAVDAALWDLKARLLEVPLADLLGRVRAAVPVYGSGGFTTYSLDRLREQLGGWAADGIRMVKMKVGTDPSADLGRVAAARDAIGPDVELFVDANGAWTRAEAIGWAAALARFDVRWLEEPVVADDVDGLRILRERVPPGMAVAAGEYAWSPADLERLLAADAVDCLQADVTRCLGVTGWMAGDVLCRARSMPYSAHCAPALHAHPAAAATQLRHVEHFHDHVRIEGMLFDGVAPLRDGRIWPSASDPGNGLAIRPDAAARWQVWP
jgi:L-alanine-DL-glutamate epimerase-like enolase superfamily enzyme